jgi:predicted nuclease of predicted toxin-antitoxin system
MRLLFDQNLSRHLADRLADLFPDSLHVSSLGLSSATDLKVWETARGQGLALITRDADFNELQILQGFPPHVIWIRRGNCTTGEIEALLRQRSMEIRDLPNTGNGLLIIK